MKRLVLFSLLLSSCAIDKESSSVFLAKEMCSCHFLLQRTETQCKDSIRFALALGDVEINRTQKEVVGMAEDGSHTARFQFVSNQEGCQLQE